MGKQLNYITCIDFETGGLNCTKNPVTQVGMEIIHPITFKVIEKYSDYILPYPKKDSVGKKTRVKAVVSKRERDDKEEELYEYTADALKYTNITMDTLYSKGKPIQEVMGNMVGMFQRANPTNARNYKTILLGQNLIFDIGYLQHMAVYCKVDLKKYLDGAVDFYGNFQPNYFDTLHLGKVFFAPDDKTTSHKLGLMSNKLDVELVNAHDAMADVEATTGIFTKLMNNMRSSGGTEINDFTERVRDHFDF